MAEDKKEETLKNDIFSVFSKCRNELSPDRRQVYFGQLCGLVIKWCKQHLHINADEMGLEIFGIIKRFAREENSAKIPTGIESFFKYLNTALKRGATEYYRKYESGNITISKEKKTKLRIVEDSIRMKESSLGRKLTNDERSQCISKWFCIWEYSNIMNFINTGSIYSTSREGDKEIDALNSATASFNMENISNNPQTDYLLKFSAEIICDAIKSVLEKKREKARECSKALFTLFCIDKSRDIEELYLVLDHEILEACKKDSALPKQYEIYQKYYPGANKNSTKALSSKMLNDFLDDLESYLKEKNPEIFS